MRRFPFEKLGEVWREPGLSVEAVSQRLSGDPPPTTDHLELTLAVLGLDPVEFQRGVRDRFHPELALDVFIGPRRRHDVDRFQKGLLARPPKGEHSPAELAEMAEGLESLRFRDADEARRQAIEILRSRSDDPDVDSKAWGAFGVILRHRGRLPVGARCLMMAFRTATSPAVKAQTLQRIAMMLLFNGGNPGQALQAIRRARKLYRLVEDRSGIGKTWVDEAVVQGMSGHHRAARNANHKALRYLDEKDLEHRFAALQGVAVASVFLGDADEAFRYLDEASDALGDDEESLYLRSGLWWLRGELSLLLGQYAEAAEHLSAVWDAFLDLKVGPLEVTLISLRVAKAHWLQGDRQSCRQILEDLVAKDAETDRANPLLGPVLSELLHESAEDSAAAELLEQVYLEMREGASSVPPLLPSSLPDR